MANAEEEEKPDTIRVCCGSDCSPRGARSIMERIVQHYQCNVGEHTGNVAVDFRGCTGYCSLGPNVAVNENVVNHCTPENVINKIEQARTLPPSQGLISDVEIEKFLNDELF